MLPMYSGPVDWTSRIHRLVRLLREYEPVALLYRLPDVSQALLGACTCPNIGVWLSDEIPCSEYFRHFLRICAMIDEVFGPARYRPVILNSASVETQKFFAERGITVYARDEAARMSFLISVSNGGRQQVQQLESRREPRALCSKIVELGHKVLLRRDSSRKGLLIDFPPPTIQA